MAIIEIIVSCKAYSLKSVRNTLNDEIIDCKQFAEIHLIELITFFKNIGLNIFPSRDAHFYNKDIGRKHDELERYVYECMAHLSCTHNFMHSEFNQNAHRREIIIQFQHARHPADIYLAKVTPLNACLIQPKIIESDLEMDIVENEVGMILLLSLLVTERFSLLSVFWGSIPFS